MKNRNRLSKKITEIKLKKNILNRIFEAGPFVVAIVAIASLYFSNRNLNKTLEIQNTALKLQNKTLELQNTALELQSEQRAFELYSNYNQAYLNKPKFYDTYFTLNPNNWTREYKIFAQNVIFLSEEIFKACPDKPEWKATIESMLYPHLKYYLVNDFLDETFNAKFKIYCYTLIKKYNITRE
jgi:CHASE3 domain sensor protein